MKLLMMLAAVSFSLTSNLVFAEDNITELADAIPQSTEELEPTFQGLTPEEMTELEAMEAEADIGDSVSEGQAATLVE